MTETPLIVTTDLKKVYTMGPHKLEALAGVNLTFARGEFAGLVGPSGSGKTTLLNIIGSLDVPTEGSAVVMGLAIESLSHRRPPRLRNRHIGFIFQTFNLLPVYSVYENVEFAAAPPRRPAGRAATQGHGRPRMGPPRRPGQVTPGPAFGRREPAGGHRPGHRQAARRSSWPTSRRPTSTPRTPTTSCTRWSGSTAIWARHSCSPPTTTRSCSTSGARSPSSTAASPRTNMTEGAGARP